MAGHIYNSYTRIWYNSLREAERMFGQTWFVPFYDDYTDDYEISLCSITILPVCLKQEALRRIIKALFGVTLEWEYVRWNNISKVL